MNIKIPHSWLTEYVKTNAKPFDLAKALSLCSASVERLEKVNEDFVYNIEVTTNRIDMLSVYGIAREAAAVLPRFDYQTELAAFPQGVTVPKTQKDDRVLKVKIKDSKLCPRFAAVLIDNVTVKPSPRWIRVRLENSGIRSLNSVVDISNYGMLETGHPMHTFDYDKIGKHTMVVRESRKGETIITLDGIKRVLNHGTIVIEDGNDKLIDLCGIMGAQNSAVSEKTKRVLLFVQTYDPAHIRRTCQELSFRTEAAVRFEKGMDSEGIFPALEKAAKLFRDLTGGRIVNKAIDIYKAPTKEKTIHLTKQKVKEILGVEIEEETVKRILTSLQFKVKNSSLAYQVTVPSFRAQDVSSQEDLIEEIARVFGYHNLPSLLPEGQVPNISPCMELYWEEKTKHVLKYWGFTETYTYSLISKNLLEKGYHKPENALKLQNPLTEENEFLRPFLLPSLLEVVAKNQTQTKEEKPLLFELSMTYQKQKEGMLPNERPKLAVVITGGSYFDIKGVVEQLGDELGIQDFEIQNVKEKDTINLFDRQKSAVITKQIGYFGEINKETLVSFGIKGNVSACELDCLNLFLRATTKRTYIPPSKFPSIIEDLTFVKNDPSVLAANVLNRTRGIDQLITGIKIITVYQNTLTLRITYQSPNKTLTNDELVNIRRRIVKTLENKFQLTLKGSV